MGIGSAIFTILVLIGDVYAIFQIAQSRRSLEVRAGWVAAILLLPLLGLLVWYFAGPREHITERG